MVDLGGLDDDTQGKIKEKLKRKEERKRDGWLSQNLLLHPTLSLPTSTAVFFEPNLHHLRSPQSNVDHITGNKIRKGSVFSRGKLPGPLRQLQMDLRKLILPYTALKLKEKKRNNLKDFLNVAGPMGVTHFLVLSKIETLPVLRVAKTPQGPTLNCALVARKIFSRILLCNSKYIFGQIVLSSFAAADEQLRLTTMVFKNIFPDIDINTVKLSSCQRIVLLNYNKNVSSLHVYLTVWLVFIFKLLNASI
ncbi:hypothetical protein Gotur_012411 [Gossypium turneri]